MKLNLICSNKNSGAGFARNLGIRLSLGHYLWFIDSDDVITENALEEFNNLTGKYEVDVLYCAKYYENIGEFSLRDRNGLKEVFTDNITEPVLMSDNLKDRMDKFCEHKYIALSCNQLVRRSFILKNDIKFPLLRCGEDCIFGFYLLCLAKKILCVPNAWYVWRQNVDSVTRGELPVDKLIHRWVDSLFKGVAINDKLMNKIKFFSERPEYRHRVYELFIYYHANRITNLYAQIPAGQLDPLIRRELEEVKDKTALTAFLFSRMNVFNVQVNVQNELIRQMEEHIKKQALISQQRESTLESVQNYISDLQSENNRLKERVKSLQSQRLS